MSEVQQAAIRFVNFFVKESHIILTEQGEFSIKVNFTPKGYIFKALNQFHLELNVEVIEEANKFNIQVKTVSIFDYDQGAEIKDYTNSLFLVNAPAIAFPYIRAYVSNLTTQSGLFTVTLPTFNLTSIGNNLKTSMQVIE
ncbi:protein-export chaperone SecB [Segetibacter sp. 3557_3]|uniref:protein-export chaperone SecB n=1 Tax=Segetibacter sp. 3557_3 TaxID=2547429 RepID=UPI00140540C6|nr:protein-export chaperone SecB [Segetibacter sp. 3557_3]